VTKVLDGKVALITGGSRGIGAAVVSRLAEDGADVAFTYLQNVDRASDVVERVKAVGRRAMAVRADSADAAAVKDAVARRSTSTAASPSNLFIDLGGEDRIVRSVARLGDAVGVDRYRQGRRAGLLGSP
jgi:NAD(P)-dependent dehydrogenase (short-subunit alcohol dehydrogenase family)